MSSKKLYPLGEERMTEKIKCQHGVFKYGQCEICLLEKNYATLAAAARRLVEAADMFVHRDRNTKDMPLRDGVLYSQKSYKGLLVALAEVEALLKEKTK